MTLWEKIKNKNDYKSEKYILFQADKNKQTFILSSGASLSKLSNLEKSFIQSSNLIISMNKYLLFYELIGIIPHHHLQFDTDDELTKHTLEKIRSDRNLNNVKLWFTKVDKSWAKEIKINKINRDYNQKLNKNKWATKVEEEMFGYIDTQSSVINFAHILAPRNIIKLVGCDMNIGCGIFWGDRQTAPGIDIRSNKTHLTRAKTDDTQQKEYVNYIKSRIENTGGEIYNCNKDSYYCQLEIMEYKGIYN